MHEVAHAVNPAVRTVYVDNDPVVYTHGQALMADGRTTEVVTADVRRPDEILNHPVVRQFIDFQQPVALLLLAVLHHLSDDEDPSRVVAVLRDGLPGGRYLVISSFRMPGPELAEHRAKTIEMETLFHESLGSGHWRPEETIRGWFGDWELLPPGLVPLPDWRPDEPGQVTGHDVSRRGWRRRQEELTSVGLVRAVGQGAPEPERRVLHLQPEPERHHPPRDLGELTEPRLHLLVLGDALLMLADLFPGQPGHVAGSPSSLKNSLSSATSRIWKCTLVGEASHSRSALRPAAVRL